MINDPGDSICNALPVATDQESDVINSTAAPTPPQENYSYDEVLNASGRPLVNANNYTGGSSGCLLSPAPGLGQSAYGITTGVTDPDAIDRGPQ